MHAHTVIHQRRDTVAIETKQMHYLIQKAEKRVIVEDLLRASKNRGNGIKIERLMQMQRKCVGTHLLRILNAYTLSTYARIISEHNDFFSL